MTVPIVVAMGGNSLLDPDLPPTGENPFTVTARAVRPIASLIRRGERPVLTHGNGPQIGFMRLRGELAKHRLHEVPLDSLVADSQGALGYRIQRGLREELREGGRDGDRVRRGRHPGRARWRRRDHRAAPPGYRSTERTPHRKEIAMNDRCLPLLALLVCLASSAQAEPAVKPGEPLRVGAAITVKKATDIDRLTRNPRRYLGRTVRIAGIVKNVCQDTGCWVEVASAKGGSFMARSLDESVLLPKDCIGRRIVVQGVVTTLPASGAEAHVHAEIPTEGHVCPAPAYLVATQGVELARALKD